MTLGLRDGKVVIIEEFIGRLHVMATEADESRRIDRQLVGRPDAFGVPEG